MNKTKWRAWRNIIRKLAEKNFIDYSLLLIVKMLNLKKEMEVSIKSYGELVGKIYDEKYLPLYKKSQKMRILWEV